MFVDTINQIYQVIEIFSKMALDFHPLFLFIIKGKTTEGKIIIDIKNYISKKK